MTQSLALLQSAHPEQAWAELDALKNMDVLTDRALTLALQSPYADIVTAGISSLRAPGDLEVFAKLAVQSEFAARLLPQHPEILDAIQARLGKGFDAVEMIRLLEAELVGEPSELRVMKVLRTFKRSESLRIYLTEIEAQASVRQTSAEIAALAEACISVAVRHAARLLGYPELEEEFCVLGMGKLGGEELNYSSDVDLVYICANTVDETRGRLIEQLGKLVTSLIDTRTGDGYVFRVDLRLRPEGTQGALVQSVNAMIDYYSSWGRTWERSALLKARAVGGNLALGEELLTSLEPFIYRKYLDFDSIEELRSMKEDINSHAQVSAIVGLKEESAPEDVAPPTSPLKARLKSKLRGGSQHRRRVRAQEAPTSIEVLDSDMSGVLAWNVKIGIGGIREIEFFVQALQLVHCGTRKNLRVRNTLEALDRLLYAGMVTNEDHQGLSDAYAFFRLVEHRVQMEKDRQAHRLPKSNAGLDLLALRMGMETSAFRDLIIVHRGVVAEVFGRLFEAPEQDSEKPTVRPQSLTALDTVLSAEELDDPVVHDALKELGFSRPQQVAGQILVLRELSSGPFSKRALVAARELGRYLIQSAGAAPDPDQAFSQITRFLTTIGDRPGYHKMLADNPHATRLLVHVFGSSAFLSAGLLKEPAIFARLVGAGTVSIRRTRKEMQDMLLARLSKIEDPEHRIGVIRRFRQEETLRIGLHETGGASSTQHSNEQLSLLAEVVIHQVLLEVYEPLRTRRRRPGSILPPLDQIPFGIVAMGKLGGLELGFGSDLDIIFIYEDDRQWRLEHSFYARLAQRLVRTLSSAGSARKMYDVDTRLRPSGQQGALVVSLESFENYHQTSELWERQALLRTRLLQAPETLTRRFNRLRNKLLFERPLPEDAGAQIQTMLGRIRESVLKHGTTDVKFSPGTLVDLEFMVQFLQLQVGTQNKKPKSPKALSTNTYEALEFLGDETLVKALGLDFRQLLKDYKFLRMLEARIRIADQRGASVLPKEADAALMLARRVGYQGPDAAELLLGDLEAVQERVSEACAIAHAKRD